VESSELQKGVEVVIEVPVLAEAAETKSMPDFSAGPLVEQTDFTIQANIKGGFSAMVSGP